MLRYPSSEDPELQTSEEGTFSTAELFGRRVHVTLMFRGTPWPPTIARAVQLSMKELWGTMSRILSEVGVTVTDNVGSAKKQERISLCLQS